MNWKYFLIVGLLPFSLIVTGLQRGEVEIPDYCKSKETRKKCKGQLEKFEYDASKSTKFTYKKDKTQQKEIEVPLFFGEKYRFVFSTEGLPQPIDIEIYDKAKDSKKRTLLYSNKDIKNNSETEFVYEPLKSRKMYIDYTIPPTSDSLKKGCVVFVVGYKSKLKKDS